LFALQTSEDKSALNRQLDDDDDDLDDEENEIEEVPIS
jgi:hypothetical protein